MGFKNNEIIIGAPMVLNEVPMYWDGMIMSVNFEPLNMNPKQVPSVLGDILFVEGFSLGV